MTPKATVLYAKDTKQVFAALTRVGNPTGTLSAADLAAPAFLYVIDPDKGDELEIPAEYLSAGSCDLANKLLATPGFYFVDSDGQLAPCLQGLITTTDPSAGGTPPPDLKVSRAGAVQFYVKYDTAYGSAPVHVLALLLRSDFLRSATAKPQFDATGGNKPLNVTLNFGDLADGAYQLLLLVEKHAAAYKAIPNLT
jgi:hypothetical protein